MNKIHWILVLVSLSLHTYGQKNADYGVFTGVSSYIGDINTGRLMYSPLPAAGIFYRYNLHPRQSIRADLFFGFVRASDTDFKNDFQQARAKTNPNLFHGEVGEFAVQFEFNFLPYSTQGKTFNYTPYFAAGAGVAFINTAGFDIQPVFPFSLGFKINIRRNIGLEAEYGFRKTFYDNFDGLKDLVAPSDYAWLHNNDWYTFTGLAFTWKIYSKLAGCPVYDDVDNRRKH